MENAGYLFAAFTTIWAIFFAYLILLHNRQRKLRGEIESLRGVMKERKPED